MVTTMFFSVVILTMIVHKHAWTIYRFENDICQIGNSSFMKLDKFFLKKPTLSNSRLKNDRDGHMQH